LLVFLFFFLFFFSPQFAQPTYYITGFPKGYLGRFGEKVSVGSFLKKAQSDLVLLICRGSSLQRITRHKAQDLVSPRAFQQQRLRQLVIIVSCVIFQNLFQKPKQNVLSAESVLYLTLDRVQLKM